MSLQTFQKGIHDYVVLSYQKYLPAGGKSETLYERGWFEELYTFNRLIFGKSIPVQVYIHVDLFEQGISASGEQLYAITSKMGFLVPYKKSNWEGEIRTMNFKVKPDAIYPNCLDFSYQGCHGNKAENDIIPLATNIGLTIEQFCADTMGGLNGMYQFLIGKYNGLCS